MRILLTNDDGVHAAGLTVLEAIARELSDDVFIVAPESDQSGVAHSLSLSDPLRLREISPRHYAVKGPPTDCVIMGVRKIMADRRPDLVLSGVNRGQDAAEDVTYWGTIAGAMEGAILGVPSIALSQAYGGVWAADDRVGRVPDSCRPPHPQDFLGRHRSRRPRQRQFPGLSSGRGRGHRFTSQGKRNTELMRVEQRRDGRGFPYFWLMFQRGDIRFDDGTDLAALAGARFR